MSLVEYIINTTNEFHLNYLKWSRIYHNYFKRECEAVMVAGYIGGSQAFYAALTNHEARHIPYLTVLLLLATGDIVVRAVRSKNRGRQPVSGLIGLIREIYSKNSPSSHNETSNPTI
mgnify:CR=1 FL=1